MMQPLKQFEVHTLIPLIWKGIDFSFTNSSLFMVLSVVLPVAFWYFALRTPHLIPSFWQSLAEIPFQLVGNIIQETTGKKGQAFLPLIASIFIFVFMGNFLGLFPYAFTFTSQIVVNFALALIIITLITFIGLIRHGVGFLQLFCPPGIPWWVAPILVPVELISYLARPLSLAIRLFANMMAGHSMLKIFAYFTLMMGTLGVIPFILNIALTAFEGLVAFLQAYVFTMLSCIYLNDALEPHH